MNPRTTAIVATIASVILCGCPGLFLCIFGAAGIVGMPVTTEFNGNTNTMPMATSTAVMLLCAAVILILIPVAVAFFTFRRKPAAVPPVSNEPLPPAA